MIPFTAGYQPDSDEHLEGIITDCSMMIPTLRGYKGAPSLVSSGADALSAACRGAVYVTKLDGSTRIFAGTQTKLYELSGTTWSDVSRTNPPSAANDYTGSSTSVWRFAQFGDVSIAVNLTDSTQYSSSGDFNDLTGAPKAAVVETVGGFVMVGNYNDGTSTPDGIYWSALYDHTDWTPDVATQSGNLRLLDTPGDVTALKRLGGYAVAYKTGSIYLGVNNGPPVLWGFSLISGEIGAVSQEAVVSIETAHFFIGKEDIYVFDGTRPQPIGTGIREWFFSNLNKQYDSKIRGIHDKKNSLIYWYYPSIASSGDLDSCIVYNYKANKWGKSDRSIEVCLEYVQPSQSYNQFQTAYATYDVVPSTTYGLASWTSTDPIMAVFNTSHVLYGLTGASSSSSLTTGAIGDDTVMTLMQRVQPRFTNDPTSGSMNNYYRMTDGATYTADQLSTLTSGRFDVLRSARWHKFKTDYTGDVEVVGHTYRLMQGGDE